MPWFEWGRVRALRLDGVDVPILGGRVTFRREPVVGAPERKTWQVDIDITARESSVRAVCRRGSSTDGVIADPAASSDRRPQYPASLTGVGRAQDW
jgi:hypothetical protein